MLRLRRHKTLTDPAAVVSRFVDAANRHDADGIARCLHPDFESIQPVYPSRNFRGANQVKRNWQAIFESEPGFRLTLVRSSATEDTVWVELHGAGSDVEVAGVFIMGVEDNLVKWARVYSAVIEQPPVEMEPPVESPILTVVPSSVQEDAEELRRVIDAGRESPLGDDADPEENDSEENAHSEEIEPGSTGEGEEVESEVSDLVSIQAKDSEDEADSEDDDSVRDVEVDDVEAPEVDENPSGETPDGADTSYIVEVTELASADVDEESPEDTADVPAAVAEVQALAEPNRSRQSRNRRRGGSRPQGQDRAAGAGTGSQSEPAGDNVRETEDATRVRAAARAATTKAANKSKPGTGTDTRGTSHKPDDSD